MSKARKNPKQLHLLDMVSGRAERLYLQYQNKNGKPMTFSAFGNMAMDVGLTEVERMLSLTPERNKK
ncbi:MAG: hypothetical protein M0Q27_03305 [Candidatus Colwellbacteria bacterium]|nr:hypothetical protein [Candidatus Colwellbacteria bacterium]